MMDTSTDRIEKTGTKTADRIKLVSHSAIFYWWPAGILAGILSVLTLITGAEFSTELGDAKIQMLRSTTPGSIFAVLLFLVVLINSIRFRKTVSIAILLGVILLLGVSAWRGWLDTAVNMIPALDIRLSSGFYLFFSVTLGSVWLLNFVLFDRLSFWRVQDGRFQKVWRFKGVVQSYDLKDVSFTQTSDDILRHILFGFGSGDIVAQVNKGTFETIQIRNVMGAAAKVRAVRQAQSEPGAGALADHISKA